MHQGKFNLIWRAYTDHLREMLHNMMTSNELTDVTLVSEDRKQFKAHKVVLSATSTVFESIISQSSLSNAIIYLRGIQSHEIESILEFIYLGKATFYEDRMNEFLNVAKSLDIKEISKDIEAPESDNHDDVEEKEFEQTHELPVYNDVDKKILENDIQEEKQIRSKFDNKYQCEECNYKATRLFNLRQHIEGIHDGVKYPCKHCNYTATRVSHLQRHIKSIHNGVKYPCKQCNYKAKDPSNLQRHIKSIHEGIRYPSEQSNYKATLLDNLQKHS